MATLSALRTALATTIRNYTEMDIHCYDVAAPLPNLPGVVIIPSDKPLTADFRVSMGRGSDTWFFDLTVVVPVTSIEESQRILDELITGSGVNSIRECIFNHLDLGLEDTTTFVSQVRDYGTQFTWAGIENIGAILKVEVTTDGRA